MKLLLGIEFGEVVDVFKLCMSVVAMLLLILDSRTALLAGQEGIELCIKVVIPSLFPLMFLAQILTGSADKLRFPAIIGRFFRLRKGAEVLLIVGFLGGYPLGAQMVAQHQQQLGAADARRMLPYCSNCGPAFLFGMTAGLFEESWMTWAIWGLVIISAACLAWLLPDKPGNQQMTSVKAERTITQALWNSLKSIGAICGWIVVFRVILNMLCRWVLWAVPPVLRVAISGFLELSNGCLALSSIESEGLRFMLCAGFVSFGGLCVTMQTTAVAGNVDMGLYFPGKIIQCGICLLLAYIIQLFTFEKDEIFHLPNWILCTIIAIWLILVFFLQKRKNSSRILSPVGV